MSSFDYQFLRDFERLQNELKVTNPCKSLYIYIDDRNGLFTDKEKTKTWGIGINIM